MTIVVVISKEYYYGFSKMPRMRESDSAEMCPECGYNVKEHFLKIEQEEKWLQQEKKCQEQGKEELKKIKMPSPPGMIDFLPLFLAFLAFGLLCFFLPTPFNIIGFLFFLIFGICIGKSSYNTEKRKYHLALTDFEKYQKEILHEQEEWERQHELERQRKAMKSVSPKCPYCDSNNTSKIGAVSRGVSVGVLGLASSKIGKQWHCDHCGSDF